MNNVDRDWFDDASRRLAECLGRWRLSPDGPLQLSHACSLVQRVHCADGSPALLKVRTSWAAVVLRKDAAVLRAYGGNGVVRFLTEDYERGALLQERLDHTRPLSTVDDQWAAFDVLAELFARTSSARPPEGVRRLSEVVAEMMEYVPRMPDPDHRALFDACAGAVHDLRDEPGDQLLHQYLDQSHVLAPLPGFDREPWLVIAPAPLVGDPGYALLPALVDRWDEVVASGDVAGVVRRRFDLMVERLGLDRRRTAGWALGRVLDNCLHDLEQEFFPWPETVTVGQILAEIYKRSA
ncbi:aminoglycoside phosphotransferase family protein [Allokutzneria sp. A3M-2-11 16]|uniref:aminoglycoside phosphotransferase family protein n=1 Tax=Allokutzneria sp. A3M-2-11 16 TaxID=2962043 RepID=UPI0020B8FD17|nr:aminoglycoside phosphotransferase family protein [Allokutzneria sp. A3M-2-11 16]MCP3802573.1 aminoglycoside phosphotransferase family protein [Allokutzneria sp. A3M-2-11 16]